MTTVRHALVSLVLGCTAIAALAGYYTVQGDFSYALNSVNNVVAVNSSGSLAVSLTGTMPVNGQNALITSFDPNTGTVLDSTYVGFGPLGVELAERDGWAHVAALTSEGGPLAISILNLAANGDLSPVAKVTLTQSSVDYYSNLLISRTAPFGFTMAYDNNSRGPELITFSVEDGHVVSETPAEQSLGDLVLCEHKGKRLVAYTAFDPAGMHLEVLDATDVSAVAEWASIPLPVNGNQSATVERGVIFSKNGRYVFVSNGFINLSAVDLQSKSVVGVLGGPYYFSTIRLWEGTLNGVPARLLAVEAAPTDGGSQAPHDLLIVNATKPKNLKIKRQLNVPSGFYPNMSDFDFAAAGKKLCLAVNGEYLELSVPKLGTLVTSQIPTQNDGAAHELTVYGGGQKTLVAWGDFAALFGSYP